MKILEMLNNFLTSTINPQGLLKGREFYKPFDYPEFYTMWKNHERSHWLPSEVPMHEDVNDWNTKLSQKEKDFLTNVFRFFTQGDVDVAGAYCTEYIPHFSKTPEIAMFLCSVASREAIHIDAYSYLIETLGMPDSTYKEFLTYNEMRNKQNYIKKFQNCDYGSLGNKKSSLYLCMGLFFLFFKFFNFCTVLIFFGPLILIAGMRYYRYRQSQIKQNIASGIALFSGFTEGMQLFSSFTMLLSFPMNGLMKGMGQIVTWSIVDETQHIDGMIRLFNIFVAENLVCNCEYKNVLGCECIQKDKLQEIIYHMAKEMVFLEDSFINLVYESYSEHEMFMGITKTRLKEYIRYIANKRLKSMNLSPIFKTNRNPLPEFEVMINAPIHTNFFENRSTDYARIDNGSWNSVWKTST